MFLIWVDDTERQVLPRSKTLSVSAWRAALRSLHLFFSLIY